MKVCECFMPTMLFIIIFLSSTALYWYLHKKTRMRVKFLFTDNAFVSAVAYFLALSAYTFALSHFETALRFIVSCFIGGCVVLGLSYSITMIRFWRSPKRNVTAKDNEIVSPADGNVIYIKKIDAGETPIAIKNGHLNSLVELTKTDLLKTPCWLIGINMTPWDVHKNCAPIAGKVTLNQYTKGRFLSLKGFNALVQNERNTYVIENDRSRVGVVQIASKAVRQIDSYVGNGADVEKGEWLGMIRFGSQVDVILPHSCKIAVQVGQQVYAIKTVIAAL